MFMAPEEFWNHDEIMRTSSLSLNLRMKATNYVDFVRRNYWSFPKLKSEICCFRYHKFNKSTPAYFPAYVRSQLTYFHRQPSWFYQQNRRCFIAWPDMKWNCVVHWQINQIGPHAAVALENIWLNNSTSVFRINLCSNYLCIYEQWDPQFVGAAVIGAMCFAKLIKQTLYLGFLFYFHENYFKFWG